MPTATQTSFAGGELTPELEGRVDLAKYKIGATLISNMVVKKFGSITRRPGTEAVNVEGDVNPVTLAGVLARPDTISDGMVSNVQYTHRMIPFKFSATDTFILFFDNDYVYVIKSALASFVESPSAPGYPYKFAHPYNTSDLLAMRYTQDADNLYICHPDYAPRVITRIADDNWTITTLNYTAPTPPVGMTSANYYKDAPRTSVSNPKTIKYAVTAIDEFGNESEISNVTEVRINSNWPAQSEVRLGWTKHTDAVRYNVYKNSRNYWGFIGTVADADVVNPIDLANDFAFRDDRIEENAGEGPPEWPSSQFGATGQYPGVLSIFEQRMIYARTDDKPNTVFGSQTGDFENMSVSFPLKDTDAIEASIAATEFNQIQHLVPLRELVVLTEGAEWIMSHGDNVDALTPTGVQFKVQGNRGSSSLRPIVIGDAVLFVERDGSTVRNLRYSFESDAMAGADLTVLAPHLFEGRGIVSWAYATVPDSILWVVMSDGALLSLTYVEEQEVWAWARHDFGGSDAAKTEQGYGDYPLGYAISVASTGTAVYLFVLRYTEGAGRYFLGHVEKLSWNATTDPHVSPVTLDHAMAYSGAATTNPFAANTAALWLVLFTHGGGSGGVAQKESFHVVADGKRLTHDSSGTPAAGEYFADNDPATPLLLGTAASDVTMGIPYTSEFKSLPLVHADQRGAPSYGDRNTVNKVTLRVHRSRDAQVGPDEDNLVDIPWQEYSEDPVIPKSKDFTVAITNCRTTQPRVYIRQSEPSPFTLLSFTAEVESGR